MSKQTLAVAIGAVVLFFVAVLGAMAFTRGPDSGGNTHTMPDGSIMTVPMDNDDPMMDGGMGMTP